MESSRPLRRPLSLTAHRTLQESVWPRPGKEPLVDVDRAVLVAIHQQAAVLTAIRALPERHVSLVLADMAHPGRIALIFYEEFFPKAQTLVGKHLHKAVETPIIIYHAVAQLPLAPVFGGLMYFQFINACVILLSAKNLPVRCKGTFQGDERGG